MDVSEAIVFRSEAVFTTESADVVIYEVGKIALGDTNSWNVADEVVEEVGVFFSTKISINSVARRKNKVIDDGIFIITEVKTSTRDLRRMVIREDIWIDAETDFINQDII